MAEKDVVYALELLHTIQIKREAIQFASFVNDGYSQMSKSDRERVWQEYLKRDTNGRVEKTNTC